MSMFRSVVEAPAANARLVQRCDSVETLLVTQLPRIASLEIENERLNEANTENEFQLRVFKKENE